MIETSTLNINEQMIADGYTCVYEGSDLPEDEMDRIKSLMDAVRSQRLGL